MHQTIHRSALAGLVVASAIAVTVAPAFAAKCQTVASGATFATEEMAKDLATQNLKSLIANANMKPKGKVSVTCETALIISTCNARQTACK